MVSYKQLMPHLHSLTYRLRCCWFAFDEQRHDKPVLQLLACIPIQAGTQMHY